MNKAELVAQVAKKTGCTRVLVEGVLNEAFYSIRKSVQKSVDVKIMGFGTFTKIKRQARRTHNPSTGRSIQVPATWSPRFRPGLDFKRQLSPTSSRQTSSRQTSTGPTSSRQASTRPASTKASEKTI